MLQRALNRTGEVDSYDRMRVEVLFEVNQLHRYSPAKVQKFKRWDISYISMSWAMIILTLKDVKDQKKIRNV